MVLYPYALFLHILSVLSLFMTIGIEWVAMLRIGSAQLTTPVREWLQVLGKLEKAHPIISLLIVLSGLYMTLTLWGWSHGWIDLSLAAVLLISVLAPVLIAPRMKALHCALEEVPDGPLPGAVKQLIDQPALRGTLFAFSFTALGIVCLMTLKPGWLGSVLVILIAPCIGLALSRLHPGIPSMASKGTMETTTR